MFEFEEKLKNFYIWLGNYFLKAYKDGEIDYEKLGGLLFNKKISKPWQKRRKESLNRSIERIKSGKANYFKTFEDFKKFIDANKYYERRYEKYLEALKRYWVNQTYIKMLKDGGSEDVLEKAWKIQKMGEEGEDIVLDILKSKYIAEHTPKIDDYFGTGDIYLALNIDSKIMILAIDIMVYEDEKTAENILFETKLKNLGLKDFDLSIKKGYEYILSTSGNYQASINPITFLEGGIDNKVYKISIGFTTKEIEELKNLSEEKRIRYIIRKLKDSIEDFKKFVINFRLFLIKYKNGEIDFISQNQEAFQLLENLKNFKSDKFIEELIEKMDRGDIKEKRKAERILKRIKKIKDFWDRIVSNI